ncbi:hypothetical protein [Oceanithermus desulfurans]|uniref:Uncharacterized protein n=2 Tax=Oceanithermus desulfurans TaxID=227924 RepID=A0A511RG00_9DEIN|nr:hypothetical protein [Oceanithermus desulfurans]MBB6030907.1 hypothetical protein [Oceanithermus desulfurans]GEM88579.1 hypothetical protein ODE01S_00130 [Oceanithermus desulfurans NBRC 100063]
MKRLIVFVFVAVLTGGLPAAAQTLVEVQLVTATALKLDSQIRLPSGSYRAVGQGVERLVAKVRGLEGYGRWEAYTAKGIARNLRNAYVHQVANAFAVAGYLLSEQKSFQAGQERHTRYLFESMDGKRALLYVIEAPDALVWLVGWSN